MDVPIQETQLEYESEEDSDEKEEEGESDDDDDFGAPNLLSSEDNDQIEELEDLVDDHR